MSDANRREDGQNKSTKVKPSNSAAYLQNAIALDTRKSAMPIVKTPASDSLGEALVSLVEQLIATEPFKAGGFDWAAQPQSYYCEKLSISPATLRRRIAKPPF